MRQKDIPSTYKWWIEKTHRKSANYCLIVSGPDKKNWVTIAEVPGHFYRKTKDYIFPEAHLIAAAPDLLRALKELTFEINANIIGTGANSEDSSLEKALKKQVDNAFKAILKAEGESK